METATAFNGRAVWSGANGKASRIGWTGERGRWCHPPDMSRSKGVVLPCTLLTLAPAGAWAQDSGGDFGARDSFAFTVENVFGYVSTSIGVGDETVSVDMMGLLPPYWGDVGLFSMSTSGINWGALLGFEHLVPKDGGNMTMVKLRPRVGYATSKKNWLGFWLRGGPSVLLARESGDEDSDSSRSALLALGFEACAVMMPVDHIGILLGPHADIHLLGSASQGDDPSYSSYGLSFGLMGEIW